MILDFLKKIEVKHTFVYSERIVFIGMVNLDYAICTIFHPPLHANNLTSIFENKAFTVSEETHTINFKVLITGCLIYPATTQDMKKYMHKNRFIEETFKEYSASLSFSNLSWIKKVIRGSSAENSLYDDRRFVIIRDWKWKDKYFNNTHLLLIFKDTKYHSLRDLSDWKILEAAKRCIYKITRSYGLPDSSICIFCHYRPSYFQLHIHAVNISHGIGCLGMILKNILVDDIIKNLKLNKNYYKMPMFFIYEHSKQLCE
ncbi:m7GpppX diphosphatase [Enteropsectra breve]|nr:m7GpppX diphosphatase [Enteropsectra breve]